MGKFIVEKPKDAPDGFWAHLLAHGRDLDYGVELEAEAYFAARKQFGLPDIRPAQRNATQFADAPPKLPSIGTMAKSLSAAVVAGVTAGIKREPLRAPKEVQKQRWEKCKSCPHLIPKGSRCAICGCFAGSRLAGKVRWAFIACPDDPPKWGAWTG